MDHRGETLFFFHLFCPSDHLFAFTLDVDAACGGVIRRAYDEILFFLPQHKWQTAKSPSRGAHT